jgi:single-stranded-DNA-specific exonuclease
VIKASARSAGEYDLFEGLNKCNDLFIKFGGHKAAAGLSMYKKNLNELERRLKEDLRQIPEIIRTNRDHFDLEISPEEITPKLVKDLEKLEPFGMGNEKPIFKMKGFKIQSFKEVGKGHIKWELRSEQMKSRLNGISFNYFDKWNVMLPETLYQRQQDHPLEAYFTIGINRFNGNEYLQLYINKIQLTF